MKEFVLNQQVAHSVVVSLASDLPGLQPQPKANDRTKRRTTMEGQPAKNGVAALLCSLAPVFGCGSSASAVPGYRAAAESQDNFIVLQNAAIKAASLLAQLKGLQQELIRTAAAGAAVSGTHQQVKKGYVGVSDDGADLGGDVDFEVLLSRMDLGPDEPVLADVTPGEHDQDVVDPAEVASKMQPQDKDTADDASAGDSGVPPGSIAWPDSDLALAAGQLARCAEREVEMLVHVASGISMATRPEELFSYSLLLQLQPYMDEQLLEAVQSQGEVLRQGQMTADMPSPRVAAAAP